MIWHRCWGCAAWCGDRVGKGLGLRNERVYLGGAGLGADPPAEQRVSTLSVESVKRIRKDENERRVRVCAGLGADQRAE